MTTVRMPAERVLHLSLICEAPPSQPGIAFGLQDRAGNLSLGVAEPDGSLRFDTELREVTLADGTVRLRGPIVHGPPAAPFLYLSCRATAPADVAWIFRLKVPLIGFGSHADAFEGRVRATGGGSVRLIGEGWVPA